MCACACICVLVCAQASVFASRVTARAGTSLLPLRSSATKSVSAHLTASRCSTPCCRWARPCRPRGSWASWTHCCPGKSWSGVSQIMPPSATPPEQPCGHIPLQTVCRAPLATTHTRTHSITQCVRLLEVLPVWFAVKFVPSAHIANGVAANKFIVWIGIHYYI